MRFTSYEQIKIQWKTHPPERGFTLPEVLVSLAILSIFIIVALTVFSHTSRSIDQAELDLDLLHEANMFLSQLSEDIRSASGVTTQHGEYQSSERILILKQSNQPEKNQEEAYIIYHYSPADSKNLESSGKIHRIAFPSRGGIDILSQNVKNLKFSLSPSKMVGIELDMEKRGQGITRSFSLRSAYYIGER